MPDAKGYILCDFFGKGKTTRMETVLVYPGVGRKRSGWLWMQQGNFEGEGTLLFSRHAKNMTLQLSIHYATVHHRGWNLKYAN